MDVEYERSRPVLMRDGEEAASSWEVGQACVHASTVEKERPTRCRRSLQYARRPWVIGGYSGLCVAVYDMRGGPQKHSRTMRRYAAKAGREADCRRLEKALRARASASLACASRTVANTNLTVDHG